MVGYGPSMVGRMVVIAAMVASVAHNWGKAIYTEYAQRNDQKVYKYTDQEALTQDQKDKGLKPVDLVKVKRDGRVKGRFCVDGQPQREYIPREQCASPKITNMLLMLILSIAAKEK